MIDVYLIVAGLVGMAIALGVERLQGRTVLAVAWQRRKEIEDQSLREADTLKRTATLEGREQALQERENLLSEVGVNAALEGVFGRCGHRSNQRKRKK